MDKGVKSKKGCRRILGILPNTLSTILKKKEDIIKSYQSSNASPARKRHRSGVHESVDRALYDWFTQARANNMPINGHILIHKSVEFAKKLHDESFKGNSGWIDRFKLRHGIVCRSISGESGVVNTDVTTDWIENKLPKLIESFQPRDVFNADETGLFIN